VQTLGLNQTWLPQPDKRLFALTSFLSPIENY